jgi:hypothetical protein
MKIFDAFGSLDSLNSSTKIFFLIHSAGKEIRP